MFDRRLGLASWLLSSCLVLGGHLAAQQPAQPSQDDPATTFRVLTETVPVEVVVTDADGNPVTDLTIEDFEVLERGRSRPITTFAAVEVPSGAAEPDDSVLSDVGTNTLPEGRLYVFALDEVAPANALRTRSLLVDFVDRHFGPYDLGAVVFVGRGIPTDAQDFTRDTSLLRRAIESFSGGFASEPAFELPGSGFRSSSLASTLEREHLRINRLAALRGLVEVLATIPARRKALVYVSEGLGLDMYDIVDYSGRARTLDEFCTQRATASRIIESCRPSQDAHFVLAAAHRGNVTIYPVNPRGLSTGVTFWSDLSALAEVTGGVAIVNRNDIGPALEQIVRETGSYYLLGFTPEPEQRVGRYVPFDVRVTRPGLTVRARGGHILPFPEEQAALDQPEPHTAVRNAIASVISVPAVGMEVFAASYKDSDRSPATVPVVVELDAATLPLDVQDGRLEGTFDVRYLATDGRSRVQGETRHGVTLVLPAPDGSLPPGTRVRVLSELALAPGRYQLRVAAGVDGQAGSVVYDLEVPDYSRGALVMSGVALTAATAAGTPTVRASDPLGRRLPGPPTTARAFDRSDELALFLEVYQNVSRPPPHTITLRTELRSPGGEVRPVATEARPSTEPAASSGGQAFEVRVPLRDVPPGRYVLHVEAESDAQRRPAIASHAIPIEVR